MHSSFMPRIHADVSTCSVWVLPACRVIQSEEHCSSSLGILSLPGTNHVVPRRWNLAWLEAAEERRGMASTVAQVRAAGWGDACAGEAIRDVLENIPEW